MHEGIQESGSKREVPAESTVVSLDDFRVQIALALVAYHQNHPEVESGSVNWTEDTGTSVEEKAMAEWVGDPDNPESQSAWFRAFINDAKNQGREVDISDERMLEGLLLDIAQMKKASHELH